MTCSIGLRPFQPCPCHCHGTRHEKKLLKFSDVSEPAPTLCTRSLHCLSNQQAMLPPQLLHSRSFAGHVMASIRMQSAGEMPGRCYSCSSTEHCRAEKLECTEKHSEAVSRKSGSQQEEQHRSTKHPRSLHGRRETNQGQRTMLCSRSHEASTMNHSWSLPRQILPRTVLLPAL